MEGDILSFLRSGGPIMVPIGLASIIALAAFSERSSALRTSQVCPRPFLKELHKFLTQSRFMEAISLCRRSKYPIGRIALVALENRLLSRAEQKELLEEVGRQEISELERNTLVLGVVASIAPLLGLLGTVWGMILTFDAIQLQGLGSISVLAGGISQALITTFAGLIVGIPSFIAHRWTLRRVDDLSLLMEKESLEILDLLQQELERRADYLDEGTGIVLKDPNGG